MVEDCRDKQLDSLDLTNSNVNSIKSVLPAVKFIDGNLSQGSTYCVNLAITDSTTLVGKVTTEVNVPRLPSSGNCTLTTSDEIPIAFQTTITITCRAWVTDPTSFPLEYIWQLWDSQGGRTTVSYTGSKSIFSSNAFPEGDYTLGVLIRDQIGSVNSQHFPFPFNVTKKIGVTRTSYFADLIAGYAYQKDILSTLTKISLLASSLGVNDTSLASSIVVFLNTMISDDGLFATYPLAESINDVLRNISQVAELAFANCITVIKLQNKILVDASQSIVNSRMYRFSEKIVREVLETSDRIILTMNSRNDDISSILELLASTKKILSENNLLHRACGEGNEGIEHSSALGSYAMYHAYQQTEAFCSVTVSNFTTNSCRLYSCGKLFLPNIATSISSLVYNTINPHIYSINFYNLDEGESNNNTRVKLKTGMDSSSQLLSVEISIDPAFAIANSILQSTSKNPIACVMFNQNSEWTSKGCALVAIDTATAKCVCAYDASGFIGLASKLSESEDISGVETITVSDTEATSYVTLGLAITFSVFGLLVIAYFCHLNRVWIMAIISKIRCPDLSCCGRKKKRRVFNMLSTIDENGQLKLEPVEVDEFAEEAVPNKQETAVVVIEGNDAAVEVAEVPDDGEFEVYTIEKEMSSREVHWPIRI